MIVLEWPYSSERGIFWVVIDEHQGRLPSRSLTICPRASSHRDPGCPEVSFGVSEIEVCRLKSCVVRESAGVLGCSADRLLRLGIVWYGNGQDAQSRRSK